MNAAKQTCRCKAYPFPHRVLSGKCGEQEESDYVRGFLARDDHSADDPRYGQAAEINRFR